MDAAQSLLLKRAINIRAIVTPLWKEEAQTQLQAQVSQLDAQLQQLELEGQRVIGEIQAQSQDPRNPNVLQQIDNVQVQVNQQKSQLLEQKNQLLQQLQQVQLLNLEEEVVQGQIDSTFEVKVGDNLIQKMQVEVVLRDGVVTEIRGEI